jgi:hypothetical protein
MVTSENSKRTAESVRTYYGGSLCVSPDQLVSGASYISREWGDYGYRIEAVESPTRAVTILRVVCTDGGRLSVLVDRWSNCRYLDTHNSDAGLAELVAEMHARAVTP